MSPPGVVIATPLPDHPAVGALPDPAVADDDAETVYGSDGESDEESDGVEGTPPEEEGTPPDVPKFTYSHSNPNKFWDDYKKYKEWEDEIMPYPTQQELYDEGEEGDDEVYYVLYGDDRMGHDSGDDGMGNDYSENEEEQEECEEQPRKKPRVLAPETPPSSPKPVHESLDACATVVPESPLF